jgi:hypothetical protein
LATGAAGLSGGFVRRLRQKLPPGLRFDVEAERHFAALLSMPVPSDAELVALQERGELPSDAESWLVPSIAGSSLPTVARRIEELLDLGPKPLRSAFGRRVFIENGLRRQQMSPRANPGIVDMIRELDTLIELIR